MALERKESNIHGFGVVTTEKISGGEEFYKIPVDNLSDVPVKSWAHIDGRWISDEKVLNWINHSCDPNAEILVDEMVLAAIRDISEGEEITLEYDRTEVGGERVECSCGSENCRGYFLRID